METQVLITNVRENELQFDISIEGTNVEDMRARFVIKDNGVDHVFPCVQSDTANRLNVIIPKLDYLKPGSYEFYVEVITNGYYFEPYQDTLTVVSTPIVKPSGTETRLPTPNINTIKVKGGATIDIRNESAPSLNPTKDAAIKELLKNVNVTSLEVKSNESPALKKRTESVINRINQQAISRNPTKTDK